jgi:hypothetical protein
VGKCNSLGAETIKIGAQFAARAANAPWHAAWTRINDSDVQSMNDSATICRKRSVSPARHANFCMERCTRNSRWVASATKESMSLAMSIKRSQSTRLSRLRLPALTVAIVFGLLAVATIPLEASERNGAPSSSEPSPNGSDNLSRKLDNSNGVISPPAQVDPGMTVKPPNDAGSMRIIPPPGSSARNPNVQPK